MLNRRRKIVLAAGAVVIAGALGGAAVAGSGFENEVPITGDALEKASQAALAKTGEGRVTDTEVGDEDGYYEVEVTLNNGNQVDVHLDEQFAVISQVADEESPKDSDSK